MESWLPFLDPGERVLPDLLPPGGQVVLVEPRRIRDRAVQLLDEEAALAETLAATWGAEGGRGGRLPPPPRCLRPSAARLPGRRRRPAAGPRGTVDRRARRAPLRAGGRGPGSPGRRGVPAGGRGLHGDAVRRHRPGRRAAVGGARRRRRARPGGRGRPGDAGRRRGGGGHHERLHPPRRQGGRSLGDRRHRPPHAAPTGPPAGPGGRRVLRRPRGRELRRAPPARRGALRGRDDAHDGRDDA